MWTLQISNILWFNQQSCCGKEDLSTFKNKTNNKTNNKKRSKNFCSRFWSVPTLYTSCTVVSLSNLRYIEFNMRTIWIGSHWAQMLVKVTTSLNNIVHSLNSPVGRKISAVCNGWTIMVSVWDLFEKIILWPISCNNHMGAEMKERCQCKRVSNIRIIAPLKQPKHLNTPYTWYT